MPVMYPVILALQCVTPVIFVFQKEKNDFRSHHGAFHVRDEDDDQIPIAITAVTWKSNEGICC